MERQTPLPGPGRYEIDTDRSEITFKTTHLFGLLPVRGTFAIRSGTVDIGESLAASDVHVVVDAASIRTGSERRDSEVRSARFLDTARHPVMTFVSHRVDTTTVAGELTVGAVARPVSLSIERSEVTPEAFTARAVTSVDRNDFGVDASPGLAGRHLDLTLEVTCVRR